MSEYNSTPLSLSGQMKIEVQSCPEYFDLTDSAVRRKLMEEHLTADKTEGQAIREAWEDVVREDSLQVGGVYKLEYSGHSRRKLIEELLKEGHSCEWKPSLDMMSTFMLFCPDCGNKRCPKASNHILKCTGSNEPGQEGSVY